MDRVNEFRTRMDTFNTIHKRIQKKSNWISWVRTGCALIFILSIYLLFKLDFDVRIFILIGVTILSFTFLVKYHQKIKYALYMHASLIRINEEEIQRLEGNLDKLPSILHQDEKLHFYTSDLDIFGNHSLFKLLNRAETTGGKMLLASWLKSPSMKEEIINRQKGASELSLLIDWRQQFQAHGQQIRIFKENEENKSIWSLLQWAKDFVVIKYQFLLSILIKVIPAVIFLIIVLCLSKDWSFKYLIPFLILNAVILKLFNKSLNKAKIETAKAARILGVYKHLFESLEGQEFQSSILVDQKRKIVSSNSVVSKNINQLENILSNLEATQNPYFAILGNYMLLWDMHALFALQNWKKKHGANISDWTNAIHHMEALSSLASTLYANPDWVFPEITDDRLTLQCEQIGHPLIKKGKRISNDFYMTSQSDVFIITGSNMSGKSTFLRTLGINAVMAFAGAPVCARRMSLSIFTIFTSMRTNDSLEEDTSSFYAELKRLKQLIDYTKESEIVFYMLDEILKGTNSKDRHEGTKALVKQLMNQRNFGIISTHDLELGNMEEQYPDRIKNYSFNSYVEDGKLRFDYTIRDGICRSFNASDLMKQIGIKMDS